MAFSFLVAFTATFQVQVGKAHPIVIPYPTRSLADFLLDANTIVLARESTDQPFTYEAHTAIKGSLTDAKEIGLFMNSHTRRLLKKYPERSSILIRLDNGKEPIWKIAGNPDPEIEQLVHQILERGVSWEKDTLARLDFFAERIRHANSTIRELAHLEIGRAPYSEIRKMKGVVPRNEIHAFLQNIELMEWHALYILFLGLSENSFDQEFIKDAFDASARFGTVTRLTAWTTAYLEVYPEEALAAIKTAFFENPDRELKELQAVLAALSAHGSEGHVFLRDEIIAGYKILLKNYPDLAFAVVQDVMFWKRWELAETFSEILEDPPESLDYMSEFLCKQYVQAANEAAEQ